MATENRENDMSTVTRRVAAVTNHLNPMFAQPHLGSNDISLSKCSGSMNDSYHRIHGEVSDKIPVWNVACDETGVEFTDIIYEKAEGEAIAKVNWLKWLLFYYS